MKDIILTISPILALFISTITIVINLSIRGEDNFQKTLDLLNAHTEYGDDDGVINTFTKEVVLRQITRRQIARAYKPFSILSLTWLIFKLAALVILSFIFEMLAISPSELITPEMPFWARVTSGTISFALLIYSAYIIMRTLTSESVIIGDNLERMIYVHYLTELGFKHKTHSHKSMGTKCKISWIDAMIRHAIEKFELAIQKANDLLYPTFSLHEAARRYARLINIRTQLKTLNNLKHSPTNNPRDHSWQKDKIDQLTKEIEELNRELTDKWPDEFDALEDWTAYTRSFGQGFSDDKGKPINNASDRAYDTEDKPTVNSELNQK